MVGAFELDELVAVGIGPGDAQRVHGGLGARVGVAHLLDAGAHGDDALRNFNL